MTHDIDIEDALRGFQGDPGPEVKRSVLARFSRRFRGREPMGTKPSVWRKPIPLYVAAVGIIIAVGLSFIAGHRTAGPERGPEELRGRVQIESADRAQELRWEVAPNDLL